MDVDASKIKSIEDLLTPEEKQQLHDDLAKMARQRRTAEVEAAHIQMH